MFLLRDIITYVRRIVKTPSDAVLSDNLIIDYINRFWITDVDARIQVFDLKTKYQFQTQPGVDQYNMPLYDIQSETIGQPLAEDIAMFPVYQGFLGPAYINGVPVKFQTQRDLFFNNWINVVQNLQVVAIGTGLPGSYTINLPILPNFTQNPLNPPLQGILRGHVDMTGIIATGNNIDPPLETTLNLDIPVANVFPAVYITTLDATGQNVIVSDSGQFLVSNVNYGLLMVPGKAPYGNTAMPTPYSVTSNTVNYFTGVINVDFPVVIPAGQNINVQCYYFQTGLPREILYYNNTITLRSPPDTQYLVELEAYLSPAAFFNTSQALPFGYMAEYLARGAARKILSDTGDTEQFMFYEPLFKEQELLVWKRSQRQFTSTRTQTIYSQGYNQGNNSYGNYSGVSL